MTEQAQENKTTYILECNGNAYRMATDADLGKLCWFSDESIHEAVNCKRVFKLKAVSYPHYYSDMDIKYNKAYVLVGTVISSGSTVTRDNYMPQFNRPPERPQPCHHQRIAFEGPGVMPIFKCLDCGIPLSDQYVKDHLSSAKALVSNILQPPPTQKAEIVSKEQTAPKPFLKDEIKDQLSLLEKALSNARGEDQKLIAQLGLEWICLLLRKNNDYGSSVFHEPILAPEMSTLAAIDVRMSDKIARIRNLKGASTAEVKDETLDQTYMDLGACCLLRLVVREKFEKIKREVNS